MVGKKYLVIGGLVVMVLAVSAGAAGSAPGSLAVSEAGRKEGLAAGREELERMDPPGREELERMGPPGREFRNLKVLPKDISSKNLQHIMIDEFEDGLGVGCAFCHARQGGSEKLDYASDAKPEKGIARHMMRMTLKLNARYFQVHRPGLGGTGLVITCTTCHQGRPRPDEDQ